MTLKPRQNSKAKVKLNKILESVLESYACPAIDGALPHWPNEPEANQVWIGLHEKSFLYSHHSNYNRIIEDRYQSSEDSVAPDYKFQKLSESLLCVPQNEVLKLMSILECSKGGSVLVTGYRGTGKSSIVNFCVKQIIEKKNKDSEKQAKTKYVLIRINLSTARDAETLVMLMIKELKNSIKYNEYPEKIKEAIEKCHNRFVAEQSENAVDQDDFSITSKLFSVLGVKKKNKRLHGHTVKLNKYTLHEAQLDIHSRLLELYNENFKLIFIFDELDKLSPNQSVPSGNEQLKEIQKIVSDLKFLLTESNAYNIFIAGKDADDSWQEDQHKGDGLFESVFIQNIYNPSTLKAHFLPAIGPHKWIIRYYNALMEFFDTKGAIKTPDLKDLSMVNFKQPLNEDKLFNSFIETLFKMIIQSLGIEFGCCTYNTCLLVLPYFSTSELWKLLLLTDAEKLTKIFESVSNSEIKNEVLFEKMNDSASCYKVAKQKGDDKQMISAWVNFIIIYNRWLRDQKKKVEEVFNQKHPITERRRRRIRFLMQYLTYKGHGIPRKILREMYSLVSDTDTRKDKDRQYWEDRGGIKYILNISSNLRKKIKFFANIVVILEHNNNFLRNLDDKGYVSIFYIIDYILKFFKTGFRWTDIENANFMTQREELYPGKTLASHLLDFLNQFLIESPDRRNRTYMLLPSIKRNLASLFLLFGPEQIELRFTKTDTANELKVLNKNIAEIKTKEPFNRFESFKSQLRVARLYELMGSHLEARHQYSKALRWIRSDIYKFIDLKPSNLFTKATITTYVSSAIQSLLRIGYLYELDREYHTSLHYYNSAIEMIGFACNPEIKDEESESKGMNSSIEAIAFSILDDHCLPSKNKKEKLILPQHITKKLYPYDEEHNLMTGSNEKDEKLIKNLLSKPLNTAFEPLGVKDTLILTAINYEKLWKPYACNSFLILTLQYLYKKGDIQGYIEHLILMGEFAIRRRDIRLAATIYLHVANQLSAFHKKSALIPPKVRVSIKAKLFEYLGDIYYATDGAALLPDHKISHFKKCRVNGYRDCEGQNSNECGIERKEKCFDERKKDWLHKKDINMEEIRKLPIISIFDNRHEELFYTQAQHFYAQNDQPLKQCDILIKKSKIRLEFFFKSMESIDFKIKGKQTLINYGKAIKSWCTFWMGIVKILTIIIGNDISKPPQYESKSLFFLDRKRFAIALILVGRMFMAVGRRNLTDFIFKHNEFSLQYSPECLNATIEKVKDDFKEFQNRQAAPNLDSNMRRYYDLTKTYNLIEFVLKILTDRTKQDTNSSIIEEGIIEKIGHRSLLWRLYSNKWADIDPSKSCDYAEQIIEKNTFLTGQLYQIFKTANNKTEGNFSISPGKKVKVSQIQLQLNRQIESFVDDEITQIRDFIQAG